ncbi:MAG TPA: DUF5777 family beta-barrel protein [Cyclobacteriaceae bacterium]|nr:DUF5777 family beta-barrel protein [Cyclobacteriaceae bacterium]
MSKILFLMLLIFPSIAAYAQEDLLESLENEISSDKPDYITNTFKATRLVHGHTVETRSPGELIFLISHRFGRVNSGLYNFFGLDESNIRFGFDYSVTGWLALGVGRSSLDKVYDGFIKLRLLRQAKGPGSLPFSVTAFGSTAVTTLKLTQDSPDFPIENKLNYVAQLLIARKFNENLSLQLMPSVVHRNYVPQFTQENTTWAVGVGGRYKISRRAAITGEYYYRLNDTTTPGYYNSLSFGVDIETGGHVFQIVISNSRPMIEKGFIAETTGSWANNDVHLGFNISRVFFLKKSAIPSGSDW